MKSSRHLSIATLLLAGSMSWQPAAADHPIAGLAPHQRPANAPRLVTDIPQDRAHALHGVTQPIPASLKFLDNQGDWFNPFTHPGMTGPYDLRGWHSNFPSPPTTK